jgi:protoporphyrinogen oxidase
VVLPQLGVTYSRQVDMLWRDAGSAIHLSISPVAARRNLSKVVVIGGGPMGLAAAFQALRNGHEVDVLEAADLLGGMAAHFDFGGISIERFYHFVCRADDATLELLRDLGIADKLIWRATSMGFFVGGRLNPWGDPVSLLSLPNTSLAMKLRYGLFVFVCTHRNSWPSLEHRSARQWIIDWCGEGGYNLFWRSLLEYKFYEDAPRISAAWIWTRIRRVGLSRKNIMQEEMGYFEGGSETLVHALVARILELGGKVHLNTPVRRVLVEDGRVAGVRTAEATFRADEVISTIPIPLIPDMIPDLAEEIKARYRAIRNIGVCCVVLKLSRSVSPHFWTNVEEPGIEIPGVIEFTNLRAVGPTIIYVPYYMPVTNDKFSWSDERLVSESMACVMRLNPAISAADLIDARVFRLRHAQPVCDVGFRSKLPPVQTPIGGLQIADTCFYYPEDRSISESVNLGRRMANRIGNRHGA